MSKLPTCKKTKVTGLWEQVAVTFGFTSTVETVTGRGDGEVVATFMTALVTAFMSALMSTFMTPLFAESTAVIAGIHQLSPICCCVRLSPQTGT